MDNNLDQTSYATPDRQILESLSKWSGFLGIMTIIGGALSCISIFGIIPGVITIIMGVKLRNAKVSIDKYLTGNTGEINGIFSGLNTYFKIQGILIIVSIVLTILSIIIFTALGFSAYNSMLNF